MDGIKWVCPNCGQPFYGDNNDKHQHILDCFAEDWREEQF